MHGYNAYKKDAQRKTVESSRFVGLEGESLAESFAGVLSQADSLDELGTRFTSRRVRLELAQVVYTPQLVQDTRAILGASQAIFAQFLGVSPSTVQDWEQGNKPPGGSAARLMDEIRRDPKYWRERLRSLARSSKDD
jgi:putative transcriptional regulator